MSSTGVTPHTTSKNDAQLPAWQQVYEQLELNNIKGITSYQVNGSLYIVVPLEDSK